MPIITSCVLMGGAAFLEQHGPRLSHIFEGLIGNVKERAMLVLMSTVELLIRARPDVACRVLQPSLARLLACLLYGQESGLVIASETRAEHLDPSSAAYTPSLSPCWRLSAFKLPPSALLFILPFPPPSGPLSSLNCSASEPPLRSIFHAKCQASCWNHRQPTGAQVHHKAANRRCLSCTWLFLERMAGIAFTRGEQVQQTFHLRSLLRPTAWAGASCFFTGLF